MADRPAAFCSPAGVWTLMPEQQPQVHPAPDCEFPWQLIVSETSLHANLQPAVGGPAGIVVQPRHLECAHGDIALVEIDLGVLALRLKGLCGDRLDARDGARRLVNRAEIDRLAKFEVLRREVRRLSVGKRAAAESLQEGF